MKKFQTGCGSGACSILCLFLLSYLCVLPAAARQNSASESASQKPAVKKASPSTSSSSPTSAAHHPSTAKKRSKKKSARSKGQQKIDSQRAQQIQEALIREHYLSGEASGTWNQSSEDAMRKYQADHGWQSKTVPDSRALISLGLGPSKDHLLNPESAMTTTPERPKAGTLPTTSHTAPATSSPLPATSTASPAVREPADPQ